MTTLPDLSIFCATSRGISASCNTIIWTGTTVPRISGDRGYQLTEECGVPLIIMEPIKGGTLASLPADAAAPLHALRPDATDASWALRWVGSHKNVHVILSGMSAEDQLTDNLATFSHFEPLSPPKMPLWKA